MATPDTHNFAVFCDFENVAIGLKENNYPDFKIRPILERLLLKGSIVVKKAYCDWDRYKEYKRAATSRAGRRRAPRNRSLRQPDQPRGR